MHEIQEEKRKQYQEKAGEKNHCPGETDGFLLEQKGEAKEDEEMGGFC